ncbi:MAG TPA: tetratricopeptide repeat protein [Bryobacteraceae bacterium]|nr:tetratricopeptide repeat protein [Bryobacteraceae bacterium]
MLSARNFVVLLAGCLAAGSLFAQNGKPVSASLLSQTNQNISKPVAHELSSEEIGDIHMARKMYREAIEAYEQSPQNSAVIWNKMGIAYHQMLQLDAAMKRYQRAMHLDSKYAEPINNAGTIYYAERRYGRAARYYKHALKLEPQSASIYSNLGTAYFAEKKYKEAVQAYDTALQLDPEVFEHRNTYGVLLQERTVDERAKFHYFLARAYAKEGQKDRAFEYIRKALEEGFNDRKKLMQDPEFAAYRDLPEFKELLKLEPRVL